jgi:hypothetical protein
MKIKNEHKFRVIILLPFPFSLIRELGKLFQNIVATYQNITRIIYILLCKYHMLSSMPKLGILESWDLRGNGDLLNNFLRQFWTFIQYQMFSGAVSRILTYFLFKLLLVLVEKISKCCNTCLCNTCIRG